MNQTVRIAKIVKGKIEGKKHKDIAVEVFPNQRPDVASNSLSRMIKSATVQDALEAGLLRAGISMDKTLKPIAKALEATTKTYHTKTTVTGSGKDKVITTEPVVIEEDNIPLQLQGSDRARELLGIGAKQLSGMEENNLTPEELQALATESDEITLTRLVFKKTG